MNISEEFGLFSNHDANISYAEKMNSFLTIITSRPLQHAQFMKCSMRVTTKF